MATPAGNTELVVTPVSSGPSRRHGPRSHAVPLVIAVTGHRDLVATEIPAIRSRVRDCLCRLRHDYPSRSIVVMTGLAEGSDRLVADEALELGMPISVVLPMPRPLYLQDFETEESRLEFTRLCDAAVEVFELPLLCGSTEQALAEQGPGRSRQYAQLGVFICAHCHILMALWDGKDSDQLGGTSQVVRFHHHDVMPGYTPLVAAHRLNLAEDESDLVYHIACSRDRPGGAPAEGLEPLDASWFTTNEAKPRSREMPARHRRVFDHANEFSREAQAHSAAIDEERYSLLVGEQATLLPSGLRAINELFCASDWLAIRYQKKVVWTLKAGHACAFLTGVAYITYTDLAATTAILLAIVTLMVFGMVVNAVAVRGSWHRKYLDYRTLAEGLRVQFYWAAAGVTSGSVTKFAHDNFLQMQDTELGWIRNVMRVAGTECDVSPNLDPYGLDFALKEWLGDENSGQLGYYGRRTQRRIGAHTSTQRIGRLGIWTTVVTLTALLFVGADLDDVIQDAVVYAMGAVLLMVGIRQSYAKATAESELIKQFEFMYRIFHNARRRIDEAGSDADRRRLLKVLGDAALEEHAQWILVHRERAIDEKEALKLG